MKAPWEELEIPQGNWIELCFVTGVYVHPKIQARMTYPTFSEIEWSTVETLTKKNAGNIEQLWADATRWGCPVRLLGFRGEVVREHRPTP